MPSHSLPGTRPCAVAIVGAGPKGIGVLERICASAPELLGDRPVTVHLVDPYPPGAGRVWRHAQSPLLLMNSRAADVTIFTDDTVQCDGPIRPGPTLAEWVEQVRDRTLPVTIDPSLDSELRQSNSASFHTRRLHSAYLSWFYERVLDGRPDTVDVRLHRSEAVDLTDGPAGEQLVWLRDDPNPLPVDVVVLAVGHLDSEADAAGQALTGFADRHGRRYFPPAYTADTDFSTVEPGESVLVRGFGLAATDLITLLTEGRGGRFDTAADGNLVYRPSGAEPRLHLGSRRGVPYRPKPSYQLRGPTAEFPRFFGLAEIDALIERPGPIRFWPDLWPLIAKEIGWGYYTELFGAHPDRVHMRFEDFATHYAQLDWGSAELRRLVDKAVPFPRDRLDVLELDQPLSRVDATEADDMAARVRCHIRDILDHCRDPAFSADLGALGGVLSVFRQLPRVVGSGKLDPTSQLEDVDGWWFGFFSYLGSGPPPVRLVELLALEQAGVVSLIGPDMWVETDESLGLFVGGSRKVLGAVTATTLIDARLPGADVAHTTNPIVRAMHRRGQLGAEKLILDLSRRDTGRIHTSGIDGQLFDADGVVHPRRFALGPHTSLRIAGAFSKPRTNALGFRENDRVARQVLRLLQETPPSTRIRHQRKEKPLTLIRKTHARILTRDLDGTVTTLRTLVGRDPDLRVAFGRFDIGLIGDFCVLTGSEEAMDRYRGTVGPVIVDDLTAVLALVEAAGAEITLQPFDGPAGRGFLARHADGVEYEYIEFRPDLARVVFGAETEASRMVSG
ncbi:adenylate cyclase [Nocardia sp. SYP-A9097]|uniref:FAD/NAD(P)-binding protein n=1 Tax=Nocardia sp. SYP-A9097 TaxID=2663237 RepID=UPI00129ACA3D|nr:FAD/NAD(P)-binding protein [Nocardia sp. SYP-A9097]MRH93112.1 adenylate cyclase [Nocardia sp. SYP-A9097]